MDDRENLKRLFNKPAYYVEISGQNDFAPPYRIQCFGDSFTGGFHLQSKMLLSEQKKYKYIMLDVTTWSKIVEAVESFMSLSSEEKNADSNWSVNAFTKIKVLTPNDRFERDFVTTVPNKKITDFINLMLDFCPILKQ